MTNKKESIIEPRFTTFKEYGELASRTLVKLESRRDDDFHMLMGMSGEFGEIVDCFKKHWAYGKTLDVVNLKEEIGDYCWYIACSVYVNHPEKDVRESLFNELDKIVITHLENLPSFTYKDSPKETKMFIELIVKRGVCCDSRDLTLMMDICAIFEIDFFSALRTNINKLAKRYADKFTSEEAVNRNLKEERKILEE